jgi:hypothetical protein
VSGQRVASALHGRFGIPEQIREQMASIEREAEALRARLWEAAPAVDPLMRSAHATVCAAIDVFLDDQQRGALSVALARALRLRPGSSQLTVLLLSWGRCRGAGERFLARNAELSALRRELEAMHEYHELPWHVSDVISSFDLVALATTTAPFLASQRYSLAVARARLDTLRELARSIPSMIPDGRWPTDVSRDEVAMAIRGLSWEPFIPRYVTRRRRLKALGDELIQTWSRAAVTGTDDSWPVQLARELMERTRSGHGAGSDDLDAASLLLCEGTLCPTAPAVNGAVLSLEEHIPSDGYGVRYLFGPYALIRSGARMPVVLTSSNLVVGASVSATVQLAPAEPVIALPFSSWGSGLFELTSGALGPFMAVRKQAKLKVVGRVDDVSWLAKVTKLGRLSEVGGPGVGVVSLRNASQFLPKVVPLRARPDALTRIRFGGLIIQDAEVAVEDHHMAELHTAVTVSDVPRLEDERAFFALAARHLGGLVARPVGYDERSDGYCYAPMVAMRIDTSETLMRLRDHEPMQLVRAVAAMWYRLSETAGGLALGLYHETAVSFRVLPGREAAADPLGATLEAVVNIAPYGRRIGERYPMTPSADAVRHRRLGGRDLQQLVAEHGVATKESEARSAALMIIDLLAKLQIDCPDAPVSDWGRHLSDACRAEPDAFHASDLVAQLADSLTLMNRGVVDVLRSLLEL